jgi:hypothetical protein
LNGRGGTGEQGRGEEERGKKTVNNNTKMKILMSQPDQISIDTLHSFIQIG